MINERWVSIKNFPMYEISNKGRVKSYQMGYQHLLKATSKIGYSEVFLCKANTQVSRICIHVLVLEAFIGSRPKNHVANHKDGNKQNNCVINLEWVTHQRNTKHSFELGLQSHVGSLNPQAKLNETKVLFIKRLLFFRVLHQEIADLFTVSVACIRNISIDRTWFHIKFESTLKDISIKNDYLCKTFKPTLNFLKMKGVYYDN